MLQNILSLIHFYIRPVIKWFLHHFTRLSELQRICYGAPSGAARTSKVEISLNLSRQKYIKEIIRISDENMKNLTDTELKNEVNDFVRAVLIVKKIKPNLHPDFPIIFGKCMEQILGYKRLLYIVEELRKTNYDCNNLKHEETLLDLWFLLKPNESLEGRISKRWQEIGFQGDDPKTDFRGMGILGLENLLYFVKEYTSAARHVLSHSQHPKHGYTFAIVGINLTSMAYNLLKSGRAKTHFYNITKRAPTLYTFHKFYCYLFFEFDRFWIQSKPNSIMDFSVIREKFENSIENELKKDNVAFKMNLLVENI